MTYAARALQRARIVASSGTRLVTVVESTCLAPNATVHVVKVGDRYCLVGAAAGGLTHLADVERDVVEAYIGSRRRVVGNRAEVVARFVQRFRKER